jgi:ATP-binding cassette subfamily B protein
MSTLATTIEGAGLTLAAEPSSTFDFSDIAWPLSRLGEGLDELARRAGLSPASSDAAAAPRALHAGAGEDLDRWMQWAADRLGVEAEPVATPHAHFGELLSSAGPAVLRVPGADAHAAAFLLVLRSRGRTLHVIAPDLSVRRCAAERLRRALCQPCEAPHRAEVERLIETAEVPRRRRGRVRQALLRERLAGDEIGRCWILRLPPSAPFWQQLAHARMPKRVASMVGVFAAVYGLEIIAWGLIGNTTLAGRLDLGWLAAWALMVLSLIPLKLLGGWLDSMFALDVSRMLKSRLLAGALRMDLETVRRQGIGQLLGRVIESQALESLALNGGFGALVALLELVFAATILAAGAGGALHVAMLVVWLAISLASSWRYFQRMKAWTFRRLDMTHDLVERMVGHRTRLAQERPGRRDEQEDRALKDYLNTSKAMDKAVLPIVGGLARGWILLALLGLAPAFVAGTATAGALAIALGGMMLANRAMSGISGGLTSIARASLAWSQVAALFNSARKTGDAGPFIPSAKASDEHTKDAPRALVDASSLVFRYRDEGEPVLRGADLRIERGERILLEGSSGGGKSTLASLLVGLREPNSGLLLLNGLDRHTLGESWHKLATEAPQFHENHILSGTLGFNLLMGRNWPASDEELDHAEALCRELGLGDLLDRMPSGMNQMVGETGWQLSHGEKSRIFLARALLQNAQLTVLDESFAALDPETLEKCLKCAFDRAQTLMVIAHP